MIVSVLRLRSTTFLAAGIATLAAWCAMGQIRPQPAQRVLKHQADVPMIPRPAGIEAPAWRGGKLLYYVDNQTAAPLIYIVDRDGDREQFTFRIPEASAILIVNVAASPDGEIAVAGGAITSDSRGTPFLARVSADRQNQVITRLHPYSAGAVTFAPDGAIWTLGHLSDDARTRDVAYHVLRRFDQSGKVLGSRPIRLLAGQRSGDEMASLHASPDRVGLYTAHGEYIEFSLDGSEIGRYPGPDGTLPDNDSTRLWYRMALSEQNDVVVSKAVGGLNPRFWKLDRAARVWVPLSVDNTLVPRVLHCFGYDGSALVLVESQRMRRFEIE